MKKVRLFSISLFSLLLINSTFAKQKLAPNQKVLPVPSQGCVHYQKHPFIQSCEKVTLSGGSDSCHCLAKQQYFFPEGSSVPQRIPEGVDENGSARDFQKALKKQEKAERKARSKRRQIYTDNLDPNNTELLKEIGELEGDQNQTTAQTEEKENTKEVPPAPSMDPEPSLDTVLEKVPKNSGEDLIIIEDDEPTWYRTNDDFAVNFYINDQGQAVDKDGFPVNLSQHPGVVNSATGQSVTFETNDQGMISGVSETKSTSSPSSNTSPSRTVASAPTAHDLQNSEPVSATSKPQSERASSKDDADSSDSTQVANQEEEVEPRDYDSTEFSGNCGHSKALRNMNAITGKGANLCGATQTMAAIAPSLGQVADQGGSMAVEMKGNQAALELQASNENQIAASYRAQAKVAEATGKASATSAGVQGTLAAIQWGFLAAHQGTKKEIESNKGDISETLKPHGYNTRDSQRIANGAINEQEEAGNVALVGAMASTALTIQKSVNAGFAFQAAKDLNKIANQFGSIDLEGDPQLSYDGFNPADQAPGAGAPVTPGNDVGENAAISEEVIPDDEDSLGDGFFTDELDQIKDTIDPGAFASGPADKGSGASPSNLSAGGTSGENAPEEKAEPVIAGAEDGGGYGGGGYAGGRRGGGSDNGNPDLSAMMAQFLNQMNPEKEDEKKNDKMNFKGARGLAKASPLLGKRVNIFKRITGRYRTAARKGKI